MRRPTLAAALLFAALSYPAFAQSPADHEDHHPGSDQVPPSAQTPWPEGRGGEHQGMMRGGGGGMMGPGMMGRDDNMDRDDITGGGMMSRGPSWGCETFSTHA